MDTLRKCLKVDAVKKTLRSLPRTLGGTYARLLADIVDEYSEDAVRVFQMLCFSRRPVLLCEMVDVLAVELQDQFRFEPQQRLPHPRDIKLICSTLVDIAPAIARVDTRHSEKPVEELKFAHYSVKEYLMSGEASIGRLDRYFAVKNRGDVSIAQACLVYLLHFDDPNPITLETLEKFPFYRYAAKYWTSHFNSVSDSDCTDMCIQLFTVKRLCFQNWLQVYDPDRPNQGLRCSKMAESANPLYYASLCGLSDIIELLLQKGGDVNALGGSDGSALQAAAHFGYMKIVSILLEHGADVNKPGGRCGSALVAACSNGHVDIAEELLRQGADINQSHDGRDSALYAACAIGNRDLFNLLLTNGADIRWQNGHSESAISIASTYGHTELVKRLLEESTTTRSLIEDGSALVSALIEGHLEIAGILLANGADVNAQDASPILIASSEGHKAIAELLLEQGADANASDEFHGSALQRASSGGHVEIVESLLEHGADINASDDTSESANGTALQCASRSGHTDVVKLLLTRDPEVNAVGGQDGSALASASRRGSKDIVELLLKAGADINTRGEYGGDALGGASEGGHLEILEILFDNGADANKSPDALALASGNCHIPIVKRLLEKGADAKSQGGSRGRQALESAFRSQQSLLCGHIPVKSAFCPASKNEIIDLLLHDGVDLKSEGGEFASRLLIIAVQKGDIGDIERLVKNGIDINLQVERSGQVMNGLELACLSGNLEVVELLLREGANVHIQPQVGEYGGLLHAVSVGQNNEAGVSMFFNVKDMMAHESSERILNRARIAERLLRAGADPNVQGGRYCNALQAASFLGQSDIVRILLDHGAEINMQTGPYGSAIQAACYNSRPEVVEQLLERNASFDEPGTFWGNALQVASWAGDKQIVELLLRHGADVHRRDDSPCSGGDVHRLREEEKYRGSSALQIASREGFGNICALLREAGANDEITRDEEGPGDARPRDSFRKKLDLMRQVMYRSPENQKKWAGWSEIML